MKGSKNFPVGKVVDMETKTLKSAEEMKAAYEAAGINITKDITVSCAGVIAATVLYGSLKDIATGKLAVYDGSWAEYSKNK